MEFKEHNAAKPRTKRSAGLRPAAAPNWWAAPQFSQPVSVTEPLRLTEPRSDCGAACGRFRPFQYVERSTRFVGLLVGLLAVLLSNAAAASAPTPNIVIILADDLGYGDVKCYNPLRGKIATPNMDRLAVEGLRFTDAHSSSGVCSPSRYALLTGRYHWRTRLQSGIVGVFGPPLIAPDRLTIAGLLKNHGYRTAAIGKWHLGWDWDIRREQRPLFEIKSGDDEGPVKSEQASAWREVFSKPIAGGPTTRGFDSYFGTDVPNWPPYCFIENNRTVGIPSERLPARLLKNELMLASLPGPALPDWKLDVILPTLGDRAGEFIASAAKQPQPFFLYLPLTAPHTPLAVNEEWKGKSGLSAYADFVMETDAVVGRVLNALEKSGAVTNTIVIFTSDNGCAFRIGVKDLEAKGHFPSGPLRGYKGDAWEGGHRIPFIARWPGRIKPGTTSGQLVHQADLMATVADILGAKLPENAGEDSVSLLPLLKGSEQPVREHSVSASLDGILALRRGSWKMIFGRGDGSLNPPSGDRAPKLFDLANDLGETHDLRADKPELAAELTTLMEKLVADGRSTRGTVQSNDVPVAWKAKMRNPSPAASRPPGN